MDAGTQPARITGRGCVAFSGELGMAAAELGNQDLAEVC